MELLASLAARPPEVRMEPQRPRVPHPPVEMIKGGLRITDKPSSAVVEMEEEELPHVSQAE